MFLLVILYYSSWVAPQYDWWIFGATYYFGVLVALRSWWRRPEFYYQEGLCGESKCDCTRTEKGREHINYGAIQVLTSVLWPLIPVLAVSRFMVIFGNKKGA